MFRNFDRFDAALSAWMEKWGMRLLRYSLAVVFIWFGILKPIGVSPASELVERTVYWFPPDIFIPILGWWEVLIGICMIWRPLIRVSIFLLLLQMPGTMLPLFLLPEVCFTHVPWGLTLEGQYIIKNLALVSAALVVGGTVRREDDAHHRL